MKAWTRASAEETICGGPCDRRIRKGEPMLEFKFPSSRPGHETTLRRCAACAGEPVPNDLAPLAERTPIVPTAHLRTGPNVLPFDYKTAQAGREPGDDDE